MSKEMNSIHKEVVKYDIYGGIIFSLILFLVTDIKISIIFLFGLALSVINFVITGKIIEKLLIDNKNKYFVIIYVLKIVAIIICAIPFIWELKTILAYMGGYISHFIFLSVYWFKNERS